MRNLWREIRFSFRMMGKNPGFTAVLLMTLAVGIGASTAIFSVVYAILLRPLPYPHPEQLVVVWSRVAGNKNVVSAGDYLDWTRESSAFQALGSLRVTDFNLAAGEKPELISGCIMTVGYLERVFGETPFMGRYFLPEEGTIGKNHVLILSNKLWRDRFVSDPNIIGREIRMNGELYVVIGVRPAGQADRMSAQVAIPMVFSSDQINHDYHWLVVFGRLKPEVTIAQANADMELVTSHIAEVHPNSNRGWGASVEPLKNNFLDVGVREVLWLLQGAVGLLLLISCANIANLLLARANTRQKEVAVRSSVGATRGHLFRQFLVESHVLAFLGGLSGVALAWMLLKLIIGIMPPFTLPEEADVRIDLSVLAFVLGTTALAGLLFGCVPALETKRHDLSDLLKESSRSSSSVGRHSLRRGLVVIEFALAFALQAGAGLAIRSLWNVAHLNFGFRTDHLLTCYLPVPEGRLKNSQEMTTFYREILNRTRALPGVIEASASTGMPPVGLSFDMPFQIAGEPNIEDPSARPESGFNMVTPGFFGVFGLRMVLGRPFTEEELNPGVPEAVVNETFVKKFLPKGDPLKHVILVEQLIPGVTKLGPAVGWQIVGVYQDVRNGGTQSASVPEIDVPFWQVPWPQAAIVVRSASNPVALSKSIGEIVLSMDTNLPLANVQTMEEIIDQSRGRDRFVALLFGGFAGVSLLLAALGIYGIISFAVAQRTREIGIRMAVGADRRRVLALILKEGMSLASLGLVLGLVGAYLIGRLSTGIFYGVGSMDAGSLCIAAFLLLTVGFLACCIPALRATRVDPLQALR